MDRWTGKVAVVTGASAGIGRAICEKLAKSGILTVGISRRLDVLEEIKRDLGADGERFHAKKCDVTKEEELIATFAAIKRELGIVHILVNNAGILRCGKICEQKTETWREIFDTNVIALCAATREAVSMMRENEVAGHIVHINSVSGHKVPFFEIPEQAAYPASKHAVTALTEILRQEMNYYKTGVKVTSISPGYTKNTEIFGAGNSRFEDCDLPALIPEDVADAVFYTLSTPPNVQVSEITIKAVGEMF